MTMPEIKTSLEEKARAYNIALSENKFDKLPTISNEMDQLVADYGKAAKTEFLDISKAAANPLEDALTRLTYQVLVYKDVADKETKTVTREVNYKIKQITLDECFNAFPAAFHSNIWKRYVEKFNFLLCMNVADDIGVPASEKETIRDRFAMKQASRDLDLGKPSNTMLLKQLQMVIDSIFYQEEEFKGETRNAIRITSHDVNFLQRAYTRLGREVKHIATLNSAKLASVLAQVLNKIITDTAYGVEYKKSNELPVAGQVETVEPPKKAKKVKKAAKTTKANPKSETEIGKPVPEAKAEPAA